MNGDNSEKCNIILPALINLGKLLKTVRYYPAAHPALKAASNETLRLFSPLLQDGNLIITIRKDGFFVDQEPISPDLPVLKNLAFFFFARLVHRILILPDLSAQDLCAFARAVSLEPEEIQKAGGLQEVLLQAHVSGIWSNEVDLTKINAIREQMTAKGMGETSGAEVEGYIETHSNEAVHELAGATPSSPPDSLEELLVENLQLEELLDQLSSEKSDIRYNLLIAKVPPKVNEQLHEGGLANVIRAISLMDQMASDSSLSMTRRRNALGTLQKLGTDDILNFLASYLCSKKQPVELRLSIGETFAALKEKAILFLINRMAEEEEAQARRYLSEALIRQGPQALPALIEALADKRWYVTRNVIIIIGKIQDTRASGHLRPYLDHKELRVRREAVRALARIGGSTAVKSLLQVAESAEEELRLQAFLALGAMKDTTAVPVLINFIQSADLMMRRTELKKAAIKALGSIGVPEAEPCLSRLLKKRRIWKKARFNGLRSCAALALGNIGGENARSALEAAAADNSIRVARAATQALNHIQQG